MTSGDVRTLDSGRAYVFAAVGGAVIWIGTQLATGVTEAWDSDLYLTAGLPAMALLTGALGYVSRANPWMCAFALAGAQFVVMIVNAGGDLLFLVSMPIFGILALPCVLTAYLGGSIRKRRGEDPHDGR